MVYFSVNIKNINLRFFIPLCFIQNDSANINYGYFNPKFITNKDETLSIYPVLYFL